jgi:succinoglycan biosynthesis protein ExoO
MSPKVSVIIPTYNSEKYVAKAIESALQQTEPNVEVIVVDDASVDATTEVVQHYCSDRLKLIVNQCNRGPSYTRNRGFKAAKGEWVALLDSDDWYVLNRLEKLLQVAIAQNADFVVDDLYLITRGAEQPWSTRFSEDSGFGSRRVRFNKITQINSVDFVDLDLGLVKPLIKRNFLIQHQLEFDENLRYGEDFQFFLISLLKGARFIVVPEPYYFYYSHRDSMITEHIKCQEEMHQANLALLEKELVKNNPKLTFSLSNRVANLDKKIKINISYTRVMLPLKQGKFLTALTNMVHNPLFFRFAGLELLRRLNNQWRNFKSKLSGMRKFSSNSTV